MPEPRFSVVRCPTNRADQWAEVAWLLRSLRDCAHYQQPALKDAAKLDMRVRQSPEQAYDIDFFQSFAAEAGWRVGR